MVKRSRLKRPGIARGPRRRGRLGRTTGVLPLPKPSRRALSRRKRIAPRTKRRTRPINGSAAWAKLIPDDHWSVYRDAIQAVRSTGLPFMLGGGFGLATYIGHWRNTKDIDLYILPEGAPVLAQALGQAGFSDYYEQLPYDRGWIYRSYRQGLIVDLIWSMANRRAQVEQDWFAHAKPILLRDELLQILPPEELLWCKLYVFQRDHCDWPDLFNLLYAVGPALNWPRLLKRVGTDLPV